MIGHYHLKISLFILSEKYEKFDVHVVFQYWINCDCTLVELYDNILQNIFCASECIKRTITLAWLARLGRRFCGPCSALRAHISIDFGTIVHKRHWPWCIVEHMNSELLHHFGVAVTFSSLPLMLTSIEFVITYLNQMFCWEHASPRTLATIYS